MFGRSQRSKYLDRHDAGQQLAKRLEQDYKNKNALVLGIPRGGVVIAFEISRLLNAELSVVVTKKLPHPLEEELAIGAIAEDGSIYLTSMASDLKDEQIKKIIRTQETEIESRVERFRGGKPIPVMANRIVIIADDGIATGATIVPAIELCRRRRAGSIIVASPVSGKKYLAEIDNLADNVVIGMQPPFFSAVGEVYKDFHDMTDEEVTGLLDEFERHGSPVRTR